MNENGIPLPPILNSRIMVDSQGVKYFIYERGEFVRLTSIYVRDYANPENNVISILHSDTTLDATQDNLLIEAKVRFHQ